MTTLISIGLPSSNEVALVTFLSDVTNNPNHCRPKYDNGECHPSIRLPGQFSEPYA